MPMAAITSRGRRTSRTNPCPICGNHHGCKIFDNYIYCLRADRLSDGVLGYSYIKELDEGMGSVFVSPSFSIEIDRAIARLQLRGERPIPAKIAQETGYYSSWIWPILQRRNLLPNNYQWEHEESTRKNEFKAYKAAAKQRLLTVEDRSRQYETLCTQLELSPNHRIELVKRGLSSSAIERIGFRSWVPSRKIEGVTDRLAGIDGRGDRLMGGRGIFIPAKDPFGKMVGGQIRTDNGRPSKYIWVSSVRRNEQNENIGGNGPQLPDDELPLFVCRPGILKNPTIGLCEGGLKAYVASDLLGQVMIGASGGHFDRDLLKNYLSILSAELDTKDIVLYPDAGAVFNTGSIPFANHKTLKWCKAWGYNVQVAWWNQYNKKNDLDIDDLLSQGRLCEMHFVHPKRFFDLHPIEIRRKLEPHQMRLKEGVHLSDFPAPAMKSAISRDRPILIYEKQNRLSVWKEAIDSGMRYILDRSGPGSGKSYDGGRATGENLGASQIIYVSNDHRNPTTPTLQEWDDLEARHGGLVEVKTNGHIHRYRAKDGANPAIPSNCARHELAAILPSRNVPSIGQHICVGCEYLQTCRAGTGQFSYLGDRNRVLALPRFRAHIESLDSKVIKKGTVLIVDEASRISWTRSFMVSMLDIDRTLGDLARESPEMAIKLTPTLTALRQQMEQSTKVRYGFDHDKILAELPHIPDISMQDLESLADQGLEWLTTAGDGETKLSDLPANLRRRFLQNTQTLTEKASESISLRWLPEFWTALNGAGRLRMSDQKLQILIRNDRVVNLLTNPNVKSVVFLDGTEAPEFFEAWLESDVYQIKQQEPGNQDNVSIYQVCDLGLVGSNRGAQQQRRLKALIEGLQAKHPGAAVIDSKRFAKQGGFGYWYRDSRGSNDYVKTNVIILVGPPIPRIGDKADEFSVMKRRHPTTGTELRSYTINAINFPSQIGPWWIRTITESDDQEVAQFIRRWTLNEVDQAVGRLRADLRPDEKLVIYFLSDYPLEREVFVVKASDVVSTARSMKEASRAKVLDALKSTITISDDLVNSRAIADLAGVSTATVSRVLREDVPNGLHNFRTLVTGN